MADNSFPEVPRWVKRRVFPTELAHGHYQVLDPWRAAGFDPDEGNRQMSDWSARLAETLEVGPAKQLLATSGYGENGREVQKGFDESLMPPQAYFIQLRAIRRFCEGHGLRQHSNFAAGVARYPTENPAATPHLDGTEAYVGSDGRLQMLMFTWAPPDEPGSFVVSSFGETPHILVSGTNAKPLMNDLLMSEINAVVNPERIQTVALGSGRILVTDRAARQAYHGSPEGRHLGFSARVWQQRNPSVALRRARRRAERSRPTTRNDASQNPLALA